MKASRKITQQMLDAGTGILREFESDDTMDKESVVRSIFRAMGESEVASLLERIAVACERIADSVAGNSK